MWLDSLLTFSGDPYWDDVNSSSKLKGGAVWGGFVKLPPRHNPSFPVSLLPEWVTTAVWCFLLASGMHLVRWRAWRMLWLTQTERWYDPAQLVFSNAANDSCNHCAIELDTHTATSVPTAVLAADAAQLLLFFGIDKWEGKALTESGHLRELPFSYCHDNAVHSSSHSSSPK